MKAFQPYGLLGYKQFRYLKLFALLVSLAIMSYLVLPVESGHYGGTWLGYVLGILSALIVLLLLWYGVTKRRTPRVRTRRMSRKKDRQSTSIKPIATLQGWLSSHVYLGASLIVLATLHSGFHFGLNVHTLSYVLMLIVIASGFYGTYVYLHVPQLITRNAGEESPDDLRLKIIELDERARLHALGLPDEINEIVYQARTSTHMGGSLWQQLRGYQRDCPTQSAVSRLLKLGPKYIMNEQPKLMRELYSVLLRKEKLVLRARQEIMLRARMQVWLYLHAPMAVALLAALTAHVVAILFFW